ncbi:MFS transporter [Candidiatus Paracoxiella cheracis]|uniref:MFS transporter n=1 Tax=Candidiatus Paracoxiella cheracis TaxID=3405120 RepID=UPI003BF604DF
MKNKGLIVTCLSGTALEWFDFSLFGIMSPILAELFFPSGNKTVSLLKVFIVFSIGFLVRPIAAFYWGYLGDKVGRKKTIILIVVLMTISSVAIGLLPTYESIGIASTVLLVMFRLMQGFSASGEHAGMLAYLYESSPREKKSFFSSISIAGVFVGMALATLFSLLVRVGLSKADLVSWGWRVPFLFSSVLGVVAFILRVKLLESDQFSEYIKSRNSLSTNRWAYTLLESKKQIIKGIGVFQLAVVIPYVIFVYMVAHAVKILALDPDNVYLLTFINLFLTAVLVIYFGFLGSKIKSWSQPFSIICLGVGSIFLFHWLYGESLAKYFIAQLYFGLGLFISLCKSRQSEL